MSRLINCLISILIAGLLGVYFLLDYIFSNTSYNLLNIFHLIFHTTIYLSIVILIFTIISSNLFLDSRIKMTALRKANILIIKTIYPALIGAGCAFKVPKNKIRRIYIILNNNLILSRSYGLSSNEIMILLPHCIQNSECKIKVTNDISNCKSCGKCKVGDILKLSKDMGAKAIIATGGTLARKRILEIRPKAIIAVACERDLFSGIKDVPDIPVLGLLNERPNGPCVNTNVNVKIIEEYIKFFMKI